MDADPNAPPSYVNRKTASLEAVDFLQYEPLAYEIEMLGEVAKFAHSRGTVPQVVESVLVESFALHFRNLALFLWPERKKDFDVLALHFGRDGVQWKRPKKPKVVKRLVDRASGEVAHLTTKRRSGRASEKEWDFVSCIQTLLRALDDFVNQADPAKLPARVRDEMQRLHEWASGSTRVVHGHGNFTTSTTRTLKVI